MTRITKKDQFYAGETVTFFASLTDEEGRIEKGEPDGGVTVQVKDITENTELLAETVLLLQAVDQGTVDSVQTVAPDAQGVGHSYIQDDTQHWEPDEHAGRILKITDGTGAGQARRILRNTENRLYIEQEADDTYWTTEPDETSDYDIHESRYEANWDSPESLADQYVSCIFRTKNAGTTLINKLRLRLLGAPA